MQWWDPFGVLGSTAAQIVTDGWIAICLSVWNAGLWLMALVLNMMDQLLTPDLSSDGPGHQLYGWMFWIAGVLVVIIGMAQLATAVIRRDARSLGRAVLGMVQFVAVVAGWIGYSTALVAAASGLTRSMMGSLLGVSSWNDWKPFTSSADGLKQVTEGAAATVLLFLGVLMILAAIAHFLIIVARDAALMVIVATGPIAAAGLMHESLRSWFWKTFRWLHAAAFTPLLVVLVTGVGVQFATGTAAGQATGVLQALGTAFTSVVLICVAVFSPLALFKLLAFVDPGTSSGAAMRAGMSAVGGLQGLLAGGRSAGSGEGDEAASQTSDGTSGGEAAADQATSSRVASAVGGFGGVLSQGIGAMARVGGQGAALITDTTNQAGIGHNTYQPDYQGTSDQGARAADYQNQQSGSQEQDLATDAPPSSSSAPATSAPMPAGSSGGGGGAGGAGGAGAGGGAAAEAAVVVV